MCDEWDEKGWNSSTAVVHITNTEFIEYRACSDMLQLPQKVCSIPLRMSLFSIQVSSSAAGTIHFSRTFYAQMPHIFYQVYYPPPCATVQPLILHLCVCVLLILSVLPCKACITACHEVQSNKVPDRSSVRHFISTTLALSQCLYGLHPSNCG